MTEAELRNRLLREPAPGELEAAERAWEVVRASYGRRERVPWIERHSRLIVVLAALAALAVAAITPPGRAVVERMREEVGVTPAEPALVRLPAPGRLLVVSADGPWVVQADGSKRLLGNYDDASWSPRGLFIVAAQAERLITVEPESGDVRWSLSRSEPIRDPRWSGGGLDTRIAYRAGASLHVVAGDGSPDALVATSVAPVPPAWKPDSHVLAYASRDQRVHVIEVDARRQLWRTPRIAAVRRLSFTAEGLLAVLTTTGARLYGPRGGIAGERLAEGHVLLDAAPLPGGRIMYADYDRNADTTAIVLAHCFGRGACIAIGPTQLFRGAGRIGNFIVSPNGRWLLAGWPDADQLLFFRLPKVGKFVAVENVRREFSPGGAGDGLFPRLAGWAPPAP